MPFDGTSYKEETPKQNKIVVKLFCGIMICFCVITFGLLIIDLGVVASHNNQAYSNAVVVKY
jgi:hypothetical protein